MPTSQEQYKKEMETNLPNFNHAGKDQMGLGHTPSTRSAELVAGARAHLMPNPETLALSRISGMITARLLTKMGGEETNILWFFPARMMAIEALTKRFVPKEKPNLLLVDVAAGFSPRGLHLAQQYPKAEVIEVDLPSVIAEKKRRLNRGGIEIPKNLSFQEADLGKTDLRHVLKGRSADMITSEGLTLYLTPKEQARLFSQVEANLVPYGVFMTEVYFHNKLQQVRKSAQVNSVASFVFRLVGNVPGIMPDEAACLHRMSEAGLMSFEEFPVVKVMEEIGQRKPVDIISIMVARKAPVR
jgi:O-methyltransferase involved in polyketide biosynthesis